MFQEDLHVQTPVFKSDVLSQHAQKQIYLKMECFQPVGSFKVRGIGRLCQYYAAEGVRHFVSSSGGNAGFTAAYVGRKLQIPVTVFVPTTTHAHYINKIKGMDATVNLIGDVWDDAHKAALDFNQKVNGGYVPPFDHPLIWAGHSTLIDEVVHQTEKPDVIVVSVGGGGLLCGILDGLYRVGWNDVPILGVETKGAASLAASVNAGEIVTLDTIDTVATTLGAKRVAEKCFEWTQRHPISPVTVTDRSAVNACMHFVDDHRVLVEPACGAPLSLIYDGHDAMTPYEKVLVVICGGIGMTTQILSDYKVQFGLE